MKRLHYVEISTKCDYQLEMPFVRLARKLAECVWCSLHDMAKH